eukprot:scaffold15388_cov64-Attheya_sp.AAC.2
MTSDPLVKWLSDAMPIIMFNDSDFVDVHDGEYVDEDVIRFQTIADVKEEGYARYILNMDCYPDIFHNMEDHEDHENWCGIMDLELNIDFRFNGQTNVFEIANSDGTASIFFKLITKALMRSKTDNVGNDLDERAVENIADEISYYMYDMFEDLVGEMMGLIEEKDKDTFTWNAL